MTIEGKRHVHAVEVKMLKPQKNLMAAHQDGHFAAATVKNLKVPVTSLVHFLNSLQELGKLFGEKSVFFISQDDKARVPLGLPAAQHQSRIAMHMQYRVRLPDHDWVVADRHKLVPSVYAAAAFEKWEVGYNGPTFVAIRSGKHDKSTSASHLEDFRHLLSLPEFGGAAKDPSGQVKPIVLVTVDNGPDECPRFRKTLQAWAMAFKVLKSTLTYFREDLFVGI